YGSQRQVARRIGKSHVWVGQRLALLDLKPELQDELKTGDLTVEDARRIGKLPQEEQTEAAQTAKASRKTGVPRPRGKAAAAGTESAERQGGNAVTPPADGPTLDWDDPAAIAKVLRDRLSAEQRRTLADLLLRD